jgi:creatinine amidohydrolase
MMHLHPALVRNECCVNFVPNSFLQRERFPRLFSQGVRHAWKAEGLQISGACGDASIANTEDGQKIILNAAQSLSELVKEMYEFQLPSSL